MAAVAIQKIGCKREVTDEELMLAVQQGDREAFGQIVARYQEDAVRLAYHYVKNWEDARDLSQDAFVKLFTQADRYDPSQPFRPWFFRILVNHALNHLSRKKKIRFFSIFRRQSDGNEMNILDTVPDKSDGEQDFYHRQTVWSALEHLPQAHRNVLILRELEGLPEQEVADILGCSVGTVKSRLHYAKKKMRQYLVRELNEIEGER